MDRFWASAVFVILGLINVGFIQSSALPRAEPFAKWDFICQDSDVLAAMSSRMVRTGEKIDIALQVFCRDLTPRSGVPPVFSTCYDATEFTLEEKGVRIDFGDTHNCKPGEVLRGVRGYYNTESKRRMSLHCCKVENGRVDEDIGCNVVGPLTPFKEEGESPFFAIRNPFIPRHACPRDGISGFKWSPRGMVLKYCPFLIQGESYRHDCPETKRGVLTVSETQKTIPQTASFTVAKLPFLPLKTWSTAGTSFKIHCPGSRALAYYRIRLAANEFTTATDVEMYADCQDVVPGVVQLAKRIRYTPWVNLKKLSPAEGCAGDEVLSGINTFWHPTLQVRNISLVCTEYSNAQRTDAEGEERYVVGFQPFRIDFMSAEKRYQSLFFTIADEHLMFRGPFTNFSDTIAPKFWESALIDETTDDPEQDIIQKDLGRVRENPVSLSIRTTESTTLPTTTTPTTSTSTTTTTTTPTTTTLDPSRVVILQPREWSSSTGNFKFICDKYHSIKGVEIRRAGDERGDIEFSFECHSPVGVGIQVAEKIRITTWSNIKDMNTKDGCTKDEVLTGISSFWVPEANTRHVSLVCSEWSNAIILGNVFRQEYYPLLTRPIEAKSPVQAEGFHNIYFLYVDKRRMYLVTLYGKLTQVQNAKFQESMIIDEVRGLRQSFSTGDEIPPRISEHDLAQRPAEKAGKLDLEEVEKPIIVTPVPLPSDIIPPIPPAPALPPPSNPDLPPFPKASVLPESNEESIAMESKEEEERFPSFGSLETESETDSEEELSSKTLEEESPFEFPPTETEDDYKLEPLSPEKEIKLAPEFKLSGDEESLNEPSKTSGSKGSEEKEEDGSCMCLCNVACKFSGGKDERYEQSRVIDGSSYATPDNTDTESSFEDTKSRRIATTVQALDGGGHLAIVTPSGNMRICPEHMCNCGCLCQQYRSKDDQDPVRGFSSDMEDAFDTEESSFLGPLTGSGSWKASEVRHRTNGRFPGPGFIHRNRRLWS